MKIFKRDTSAARDKAVRALSASAARIAQLTGERAASLVAADDAEVLAIDRLLEEEHRAAALHADRITALTAELRRERLARLAGERDAAIAVLLAARSDCVAIGTELEEAIKKVGTLLFAAKDIRSKLLARWPVGLAFPRANELQLTRLPAEVSWALYAAGRPTAMAGTSMPTPQSTTAVAGLGPVGIAALIARSVNSTIARLKNEPLEDDEQDEEIAA